MSKSDLRHISGENLIAAQRLGDASAARVALVLMQGLT
jgi:hypothetical protein